MIKVIIFDFFGVLVTEGFSRFTDKYFPNDEQKRQKAIELVTQHDWGKLSKNGYIDGLASLAKVDRGVVIHHMGDNQPNDKLLTYIRKELKPKYKIGVLSNSGDDYLSQILEPKDQKLFDDIILSYRHGLVKPQPEIFELAAQRLGVSPQECLFVDDSQNHCNAAVKVGMQTIFYTDFQNFKKQIEAVL